MPVAFHSVGRGAIAAPIRLALFNGISGEIDFGQSLMVHAQGIPALTTSQDRLNLMFTGGLRASALSASTAAFVPAVEATGETGAVMRNKVVVDMIEAENGLAYNQHGLQFFTANCGVSGVKLAVLSRKGASNAWNFLNADQVAGVANAATAGKAYRVEVMNFRQGEFDQRTDLVPPPVETYKRMVRSVLQMAENDCYRTNPSAARQLIFIGYQMSSHYVALYGEIPTVAWALLDLYKDPDIPFFFSNPTYYLPHDADAVHLNNISYARLGAREGYVKKRVLIDGVEMQPLAPTSAGRDGATVTLTYPVEDGLQLVLDTVAVTDPGNYGFQLYDDVGSPMTINSVALVGSNQVLITASTTIPAGATVYYASLNGTTGKSGPTEGPRGCLRDNAGDENTFVVSGVTYANHGWAAISKDVLA